MVSKTCIPVLFACALSLADSPVAVSGIVRSNLTGKGVAGASVKLQGLSLSAVTDTGGHFTITGTTGVVRPGAAPRTGALALTKNIVFRQDAEGPVVVRILDLSGAERAILHSGVLQAGDWTVTPPALRPGVYLCAIETPSSVRAVRFLGSTSTDATIPAIAHSQPSELAFGVAARLEAAAAVDSLVATKSGFKTGGVGITSYSQTGLEIVLEDTSVVSADDATIVPDPSWTAYMPTGIPPPALGTAAFSITLQIDAIHNLGNTKFGYRRQLDIKGGSVSGTNITATVMTGGLDYELTLSNGSMEIEQIIILKVGTTPILMRNAGVAPIGAKNARMVLDFEAPNSSSYTWLNTGKYAAVRVVDTVAKTIKLDVYDISKVTNPAKKVQITDPTGVVNQTWDCQTRSGTGGGTNIFTETVALGSSVAIGASKRGSRNIIPITGGTTTGRIVGSILNGGADYQLSGLDARYTLAPDNGEFIIIRNCGPSNALIPVFEARVDGKYAFLNDIQGFSSSPTGAGSGVSITFTEKK